ncbi:MAG: dTDP-4-dehydrorhamnose reductase [Bacteroidales bacterium]|nr:dTDP-4-dehydrorhamnose reductase [Bacteroidales bacterium]
MNILVTGSKGQLGSELQKIAVLHPEHQWFFTDVDELDITKATEVNQFFHAHNINLCLNCAAYTAVDKAEEEPEKAFLINASAVGVIADACLENHALFVQISTDYVFDGCHYKPYEEADPIRAVSVYGKSKAAGEALIAGHDCNSIVIRTAWLYSAHGNNFVKTMIRLGNERSELKVVADQIGSPTWAADLAQAAFQLSTHFVGQKVKEIIHFSNEGAISWYDFAQTIMEICQIPCQIHAIPSSEYPAKTPRPHYSVLSKEKYKKILRTEVPYWKVSLQKCIHELNGKSQTK